MPVSSSASERPAAVSPGSAQAWMAAIRPRSLWVAVSPVLVGASFAYERAGSIAWGVGLAVLAVALLMQVITNLQNDVGYTVRGGERSGTRTGLPRATAQGWLSVRQVRVAIGAAALVAVGLGLNLLAQRGWPVLAIGSASLLAALAYMGGPRPIAYTPFGELTVFVFFGPVAVLGTGWMLTGTVGALCGLASVAIGSLAAAALSVNNHRDAAHDGLVGRRTFAVTWGERASARLYAVLLLAPFAVVPVMAASAHAWLLLLPLVLLPAALRLRRDFMACPGGLAFNAVLFRTFRLELGYALALSVAATLSRGLA